MDKNKAQLEQKANTVINWLVENRSVFEQQGVNEDSLTGTVNLGGVEEIKAALDHLENREIVVRWPQALTNPPNFIIKPGRHWFITRDKLLGVRSATDA
jgi:hypothetical protein